MTNVLLKGEIYKAWWRVPVTPAPQEAEAEDQKFKGNLDSLNKIKSNKKCWG